MAWYITQCIIWFALSCAPTDCYFYHHCCYVRSLCRKRRQPQIYPVKTLCHFTQGERTQKLSQVFELQWRKPLMDTMLGASVKRLRMFTRTMKFQNVIHSFSTYQRETRSSHNPHGSTLVCNRTSFSRWATKNTHFMFWWPPNLSTCPPTGAC